MKRIITISREFGSGGRTIGKMVAEALGYKYYDKELVKQVSEESGFDPKYIEEHGEHARGYTGLSYGLAAQGVPGVMRGMSPDDYLYVIQREVILRIAEESPCVIVGRCADYILKDRKDVLNVFIHADMDFRADRIVRLYGESDKSPEKRLVEKDKKRRLNYKHYTEQEWGKSQNYDISLCSSTLGIDRCVKIITDLAKELDGE